MEVEHPPDAPVIAMTYARPILEPVNASSASAGCCTPLFYFVIAGKVIVRGPCALGGGGGEDPSG